MNLNVLIPLHSNMFLLIRAGAALAAIDTVFTFQYVSINTGGRIPIMDAITNFTFQYVSINTQMQLIPGLSVPLYIPICFY